VTFDRLVLELVGENPSPAFVEVRRDAAGALDALTAAGWTGLLLTVGPQRAAAGPAAAPAGLAVEQLPTWSAAADRIRSTGSPSLIDLGAGVLRGDLLEAVVDLRPTVVRLRLAASTDRSAHAQGLLQERGYTVICIDDLLVGVHGRTAIGAAGLAARLSAVVAAERDPAERVLAGVRDLDRAALRWAERYFRRWRAVENERDRLADELRLARALPAPPPPVASPAPPAPSVRALAAALGRRAGVPDSAIRQLKRVSTRLHPSERPVPQAEHTAPPASPGPSADLARTARLDGALTLRLTQLAAALGGEGGRDPLGSVHGLLRDEPARSPRWWLAYSVLTGSVPDEGAIAQLRERHAEEGAGGVLRLLVAEQGRPTDAWQRTATVEVVTGTVLVDISHTVATALQTGVQRVVKNTVPTWFELGGEPVVFDEAACTWRRPDGRERSAIASWSGEQIRTPSREEGSVVVVPDGCPILVPELKPREPLSALRAAAADSSNTFSWIVYDMIPVLAGEYVPDDVVAGSVDYLSTLKRARRLVAISRSAAAEFTGWAGGLESQGIAGPSVSYELLPMVPPPAPVPAGDVEARALRSAPNLPLILCVSSISPHKNQEVLLSAAQRLAESGAAFEIMFIAPNAWHDHAFRARLAALQAGGLAASLHADVGEAELWSLYRTAHCVALISRVEGYGLALAESLSVGTPVLSSNFGSMAEIVSGGGGLMVDPTDVGAVAEALGRLLGDPALHRELAGAAARRPLSSWEAYARRTWSLLLESEENR
jgi:glycosyltransferase involved in cell wall biosynthesis